MSQITFDEFDTSTTLPPDLAPPLAALWWAARQEWARANALVQDASGPDAAWVHAHLHRVEGDLGNAGYWYRRAGQPLAQGDLTAEWKAIAAALLARDRERGEAGRGPHAAV